MGEKEKGKLNVQEGLQWPGTESLSKLAASFYQRARFNSEKKQTETIHDGRVADVWLRDLRLGAGKAPSNEVWTEVNIESKRKRVVKVLEKNSPYRVNYIQELEALSRVSRHKDYFVQLLGWYDTENAVTIITEYLPLHDLERCLHGALDEESAKSIASQLVNGLAILHSQQMAHRDLKPSNIFVVSISPSWQVKIGDFGSSKHIQGASDSRTTLLGTVNYTAPELRQNSAQLDNLSQVDMWSLGCLVYYLYARHVPFPRTSELQLYCDQKARFPMEALRPLKLTKLAIDFLQDLLQSDPQVRLSADDASVHPWFSGPGTTEGLPAWPLYPFSNNSVPIQTDEVTTSTLASSKRGKGQASKASLQSLYHLVASKVKGPNRHGKSDLAAGRSVVQEPFQSHTTENAALTSSTKLRENFDGGSGNHRRLMSSDSADSRPVVQIFDRRELDSKPSTRSRSLHRRTDSASASLSDERYRQAGFMQEEDGRTNLYSNKNGIQDNGQSPALPTNDSTGKNSKAGANSPGDSKVAVRHENSLDSNSEHNKRMRNSSTADERETFVKAEPNPRPAEDSRKTDSPKHRNMTRPSMENAQEDSGPFVMNNEKHEKKTQSKLPVETSEKSGANKSPPAESSGGPGATTEREKKKKKKKRREPGTDRDSGPSAVPSYQYPPFFNSEGHHLLKPVEIPPEFRRRSPAPYAHPPRPPMPVVPHSYPRVPLYTPGSVWTMDTPSHMYSGRTPSYNPPHGAPLFNPSPASPSFQQSSSLETHEHSKESKNGAKRPKMGSIAEVLEKNSKQVNDPDTGPAVDQSRDKPRTSTQEPDARNMRQDSTNGKLPKSSNSAPYEPASSIPPGFAAPRSNSSSIPGDYRTGQPQWSGASPVYPGTFNQHSTQSIPHITPPQLNQFPTQPIAGSHYHPSLIHGHNFPPFHSPFFTQPYHIPAMNAPWPAIYAMNPFQTAVESTMSKVETLKAEISELKRSIQRHTENPVSQVQEPKITTKEQFDELKTLLQSLQRAPLNEAKIPSINSTGSGTSPSLSNDSMLNELRKIESAISDLNSRVDTVSRAVENGVGLGGSSNLAQRQSECLQSIEELRSSMHETFSKVNSKPESSGKSQKDSKVITAESEGFGANTQEREDSQFIAFEDCLGRRFHFTHESCLSFENMHRLIVDVFSDVSILEFYVMDRSYDLIGSDDYIITPNIWDYILKPGMSIRMRLFPIREANQFPNLRMATERPEIPEPYNWRKTQMAGPPLGSIRTVEEISEVNSSVAEYSQASESLLDTQSDSSDWATTNEDSTEYVRYEPSDTILETPQKARLLLLQGQASSITSGDDHHEIKDNLNNQNDELNKQEGLPGEHREARVNLSESHKEGLIKNIWNNLRRN